jgi:methylase of polypeptide subunit release factors
MKSRSKTEFGDFQTPHALAVQVCELLQKLQIQPGVILEPTVGKGAFLRAAAQAFPRARLHGFDINADYIEETRTGLERQSAMARSTLAVQDFFIHDWERELENLSGELLILGNPPWVTNAGVAAVNGTNLPLKANFHGHKGIAALTGKANFDISEWMLIRLLRAIGRRSVHIALLVKTATARKFLRYAWLNDGQIDCAALYSISAADHFGAAVDASLLYFQTGSAGRSVADVFAHLQASDPSLQIGLAGKEMVANLKKYQQLKRLEGLCPYQWRSGIKHDCSGVMELNRTDDGSLENGLGENFRLESDYVYPLLKCSDLANSRIVSRRLVLVTQRHVGDATSVIAKQAPSTWQYLQSHRERFEARKSSIYKAAVPFALFGIGPYAFSLWKVAVSGLHRSARFQVIAPVEGRPVFFDDTCYYLSFNTEQEAVLVAEILNSPICQDFLLALIFPDAKRPITVDLLQRLSLSAIAHESGLGRRWEQLQQSNYTEPLQHAQLAFLMEESAPYPSKP